MPAKRRDILNEEIRVLRQILVGIEKYLKINGGTQANDQVEDHRDLYSEWLQEAIAEREAHYD